MTSPSPDGAAVIGQFTSTNTKSLALTTTVANDLIVATVSMENPGGVPTVQTMTSAHLTFAKVGTIKTAVLNIEVWTARASGILTSESITVTTTTNVDSASFAVFGMQNCTGLDPNVSLPATNSGTGTTGSVGGISTSNLNDLLMLFYMTNDPTNPGVGAGQTSFVNQTNASGGLWAGQEIDYKAVSTLQSGITLATATSGATEPWAAMVLAFTNAGGFPPVGHVNFCVATG